VSGVLPYRRQPAPIARKVGIPKNADTREIRQCFLQQLDPLGVYLGARVRAEPGDVPAWARQTSDESGTDRIDTVSHDDRDDRSRLHRRNRIRIGPGDDNIHAEPNQVCSKRRRPFQLAIGEAGSRTPATLGPAGCFACYCIGVAL
jgi:hypothetical protein